MATEPFQLPPEEAMQWFREKGYRLAYDWRDTWKEQHRTAFTVAKATQLDVLADIREAVDTAIEQGKTLQEFQKDLRPTLQRKGWWGEKEQTDPATGKTSLVQLGSARRLRTIYETNLRQAHAAGRWDRIERLKTSRPYLRYVSALLRTTRPEHRHWHNTVRPVDDPIWNTIAPLNGWGCKCKLQQMNERDLARYGLAVTDAPKLEYQDWKNARTGQTLRVPRGIDPGFDYNPGRTARAFEPPPNLPPLTPVQTFADYGRPAAADITDRPRAPQSLPVVSKPADRAVVEKAYRKLFNFEPGTDNGSLVDPQGMKVIANQGALDYMLGKRDGREAYLPHAAATIADPYETWLVPFRKKDGTVAMRKRYIGLFAGAKGNEDTLVVVERHGDGFGIWSVHPRRTIDAQRAGYLLATRPPPKGP